MVLSFRIVHGLLGLLVLILLPCFQSHFSIEPATCSSGKIIIFHNALRTTNPDLYTIFPNLRATLFGQLIDCGRIKKSSTNINDETINNSKTKTVFELAATATATTVTKGDAKVVLYFSAWQGDVALAVAGNLVSSYFPLHHDEFEVAPKSSNFAYANWLQLWSVRATTVLKNSPFKQATQSHYWINPYICTCPNADFLKGGWDPNWYDARVSPRSMLSIEVSVDGLEGDQWRLRKKLYLEGEAQCSLLLWWWSGKERTKDDKIRKQNSTEVSNLLLLQASN